MRFEEGGSIRQDGCFEMHGIPFLPGALPSHCHRNHLSRCTGFRVLFGRSRTISNSRLRAACAEWDAAEEDQEDAQQWDTSWDDDSVEDNFSKQLRCPSHTLATPLTPAHPCALALLRSRGVSHPETLIPSLRFTFVLASCGRWFGLPDMCL